MRIIDYLRKNEAVLTSFEKTILDLMTRDEELNIYVNKLTQYLLEAIDVHQALPEEFENISKLKKLLEGKKWTN